MSKKRIDLCVFWLVIAGPTLIGIATAVWYGNDSKAFAEFLGIAGILCLLAAGALQILSGRNDPQNETAEALPPGGQGGNGGNAFVGGSGTAIGGRAGHAGQYGKGGDGGSAHVLGDGIAVGGTGGSAAEEGIWRAPAKSGYETYRRSMGLPVDPVTRQLGRGGAMPGYEPKLRVTEQIRAAYFAALSMPVRSIFLDIEAVPLQHINAELAGRGESWRARIVEDEYEFFVPKTSSKC